MAVLRGPRIRLAGLVIAGVAAVAFLIWRQGAPPTSPQELLNEALSRTAASKSFGYRAEARLLVDGREQYVSNVEGVWVAPDRAHIKGVVVNTPVEYIQVRDTVYMRDQFSGRWLILPGSSLPQSELFATELNPLAVLRLKETGEVQNRGRERVDGTRAVVLGVRGTPDHPFLESHFTDFDYTLWVDPGSARLVQARLRAASRAGANAGVELLLRFRDFDHNITVNAPEVNH
ncbi:MAG: hypothetical protein H5T97_05045 [Firmicutes bacterium]|nr:hypothetical protein [Bacillota bacterium]